jgi:hypothetical protein
MDEIELLLLCGQVCEQGLNVLERACLPAREI